MPAEIVELQHAGIRWQLLATRDAHELYAKLGYRPLDDPTRWMHRGARAG